MLIAGLQVMGWRPLTQKLSHRNVPMPPFDPTDEFEV
jgi:hypothetical protein